MHAQHPIDRHYEIGGDMAELIAEYGTGEIRVLTTSFATRINDALQAFEENKKLLPPEVPAELRIFIRAQLHPAVARLQLLRDLIDLFGCPGDRYGDDPDWGGEDGDRKPGPVSPAPMAV